MRSIINTIAIVTRNVVVAANRRAVSAVAGMGTLRVADSHSRHLDAGSAGISRPKSPKYEPLPSKRLQQEQLWHEMAWFTCQLFRGLSPAVGLISRSGGASSRSRRPQGFRSLLIRG